MAVFRPFCAIRPTKENAALTAALPYDVYSRQEAAQAVKDKPLSFLNIDRPETQFPPQTDMYAPQVYQKAHDLLWQQVKDGIYQKEDAPCYYLYELTMNGRSQTGIVALASIDEYCGGIIKKHENTRLEKEQDRIRHITACNAQTGPIFLAYRQQETLRTLTTAVKARCAAFDFTSEDGIRHRGWVISSEEEISQISSCFAKMDALYIADGHHRAASAVKVGLKKRSEQPGSSLEEEFQYFLSVAFPDEELRIYDYNRVVKDLHGLDEAAFLAAVEKVCAIEPSDTPVHPSRKGEVGLYLPSGWRRLTFRPKVCSSDPVEGLDVAILQNEILTPILGIGDPRTDERIDFVGGIRGLEELKRRVDGGEAAAFSMFPTSIGELFAVADAGRLMPPKSTWFEPKLRSGLFIHEL